MKFNTCCGWVENHHAPSCPEVAKAGGQWAVMVVLNKGGSATAYGLTPQEATVNAQVIGQKFKGKVEGTSVPYPMKPSTSYQGVWNATPPPESMDPALYALYQKMED